MREPNLPGMLSQEKPRILLVEDHDMTRRMQIRFLSRQYMVDFASTGEEAIELARAAAYSAILVDIHLAGHLSGFDVVRAIRTIPHHVHTSIVGVTGSAESNIREQLMRVGCSAYLPKPFRWQDFADTIQEAVRRTQKAPAATPPPPPTPQKPAWQSLDTLT